MEKPRDEQWVNILPHLDGFVKLLCIKLCWSQQHIHTQSLKVPTQFTGQLLVQVLQKKKETDCIQQLEYPCER